MDQRRVPRHLRNMARKQGHIAQTIGPFILLNHDLPASRVAPAARVKVLRLIKRFRFRLGVRTRWHARKNQLSRPEGRPRMRRRLADVETSASLAVLRAGFRGPYCRRSLNCVLGSGLPALNRTCPSRGSLGRGRQNRFGRLVPLVLWDLALLADEVDGALQCFELIRQRQMQEQRHDDD
jgi:hypothetical protein